MTDPVHDIVKLQSDTIGALVDRGMPVYIAQRAAQEAIHYLMRSRVITAEHRAAYDNLTESHPK